MIYIFNFIQQMFELQKTESIRKLIIKPERRGGGVIPNKIISLQGKKVATKIIYVVEDIIMLMC